MSLLILTARTVHVIRRRIDQATATQLATDKHLPVTAAVAYDGTVDLWPTRPVSTVDEVAALRAFVAATDAPLRWHPAVAR